jgi:hypothetical protein
MDTDQRFDNLNKFIKENRLVRNEWGDGKERACLLLALAPEVGVETDPAACPASVLPRWLAFLTPSIDDCGSDWAWPATVQRYSTVVRRGALVLDSLGWRRVLARFLISVLRRAHEVNPSPCHNNVSNHWQRCLAGDEPTHQEWAIIIQTTRQQAAVAWSEASDCAYYNKHALALARCKAELMDVAHSAAKASSLESMNDVSRAAHEVPRLIAEVHSTNNDSQDADDLEDQLWDKMTNDLFHAIETECYVTEVRNVSQ